MARGFTRIEFADGGVVIVKALGHSDSGDHFRISANEAAGWEGRCDYHDLSQHGVVNRIIAEVGKKVQRRLTH